MTKTILQSRRVGSGPTIVLLHGVAGSSEIWQPVADLLKSDFDVISIDLLGYGYSPKPKLTSSYSPEGHLEAIHSTLEQLGVTKPFFLAGLSMGSLLALQYCRDYPGNVSKLICIGLPDYRNPKEAISYIRHDIYARLALEHKVIGRLLIGLTWRIGRMSSSLARRFGPTFYSPLMIHESFMNTFVAFRSTLMQCMIHNPALPLLVSSDPLTRLFIQGSEDAWSDPERIREDLANRPNGQLQILPGIAHNTVVIAPKQTADLLRDFL